MDDPQSDRLRENPPLPPPINASSHTFNTRRNLDIDTPIQLDINSGAGIGILIHPIHHLATCHFITLIHLQDMTVRLDGRTIHNDVLAVAARRNARE